MQTNPEQAHFWQWFRLNADRLHSAMYGTDEQARADAADDLREAIHAVSVGLVVEPGREEEGRRPVIVSADGRLDLVDLVKEIVESAPSLPGWHVVAFRTRFPVEGFTIRLEDETVSPEDVWFRIVENESGLELTLAVAGLTEENRRLRGLGARLLAEHAVGELDSLTLIDTIDTQPLPDSADALGLLPFAELVGAFDESRQRRYPPPGALPLSEDSWATLQGEIGGAAAIGLMNVGLAGVAGHPDYDRRLTVSVLCNEETPDGIPGQEEFDSIRAIGERIDEALADGQQSLLVLALTTQNRRDLIFYTANAGAALMLIEDLREEMPTHRIEATFEYDTYWGLFRSFLNAMEPDEDGEE